MPDDIRIDKWLWAVRIYKTRSQATEACRKGHVLIDNNAVKPSREVHPGDVVQVKKNPIIRSFKVLDVAAKRVSAKLVPQLMEEVTPPEELELLRIQKDMNWISRDKGSGRPTKKDRRDLDDFLDW